MFGFKQYNISSLSEKGITFPQDYEETEPYSGSRASWALFIVGGYKAKRNNNTSKYFYLILRLLFLKHQTMDRA